MNNEQERCQTIWEFNSTGSYWILYHKTKLHGKWKVKSQKGTIIGYARNYSSDTYPMYISGSNAVWETHDVKCCDWLRPDTMESLQDFFIEEILHDLQFN